MALLLASRRLYPTIFSRFRVVEASEFTVYGFFPGWRRVVVGKKRNRPGPRELHIFVNAGFNEYLKGRRGLSAVFSFGRDDHLGFLVGSHNCRNPGEAEFEVAKISLEYAKKKMWHDNYHLHLHSSYESLALLYNSPEPPKHKRRSHAGRTVFKKIEELSEEMPHGCIVSHIPIHLNKAAHNLQKRGRNIAAGKVKWIKGNKLTDSEKCWIQQAFDEMD